MGNGQSISLIVPILNEERIIRTFLDQLVALPLSEVVIVDGGSCDQTPTILQTWCDKQAIARSPKQEARARFHWMRAPAGRGNQMNAGANRATGDILLFVHADSTFPAPAIQWINEIRTALQNPNVGGGAFRLKIDSSSLFLKWIAKAANIRSLLLGLPYGDQGIFVRRDIFIKMKGYRNWPLLEDVDFVRRLKKMGKMVLLKTPLTTSARRWDTGKWRRSLRNGMILALYLLGVCPKRLARWYA